MGHFLDESSRQKLLYFLADGPALFLVEATQALLHRHGAWPDLQGMLDDFSQNAWHVRGIPCKDVSVGVEEVDERAFLFGGKCGANAHYFALRTTRVYEDLLGTLYRLKRPGLPLGVGCFFGDLLFDGRKLLGGNDCHGMFVALDHTLVGALEGGADGDDPIRSQHL